MPILRTFTRRLFFVSNSIAVLLFLLACANAFLHPGKWWLISLLGLAFPLLLLIVLLFLIGALFIRSFRPWALLSLAALLIGWPNIRNFFAFHPAKSFTAAKSPHSLRILTWNVRSFDEFIGRKNGSLDHRPKMMQFIGEQQADVVCIQEFYDSHNPKESAANISYIQQRLHYPYYYFSRDYVKYEHQYEAGVIIFSRYPILDSLLVNYKRSDGLPSTESLIAADIHVGDDTIRVFSTHLQSVLFRNKDFHDIEVIKNVDDSILQASRSIVKKLRFAFRNRGDQADEARAQLDRSPYPGLITGDFNDVPNSYTYFTIRGGWQDAWLQCGFGIGRTYVHLSPTLRIDYILADPRLKVLQCRKFSLPWSDHNPVVADLEMP
ncbi:MAG TPA: endonuclease/exonuclease/phosphatase family protein [Puia sp.]|jgi:endonuclease/exonuclease/phosphatase family metal-dependent hydrolase